MQLKNMMLAAVPLFWCGVSAAQNIPADPAVRTGKLANGFTYYIRHNEQPQKRVELYLINKVGSVLEDDDQQGLAHFMEHMNFNGTKHFPKNQLVDYLQKAGVRFGADLNAYTSFDETVYQLPIPTDDPAMFGNGIKIMRDWAQEATLDPTEIEKERGVVLEEERLGKGARDRMSRQYLPMIFNHSRYADRLPIGKDEVLTKFKPEVIRRFHHDWYRPDLQALIVVGDIDVNVAERLVKAQFSTLKNPSAERPRTVYSVPFTGKTQFLTVTDKEEGNTSLEIMMKHKARGVKTEDDYLAAIKQNLLNQMLGNRRYAELSKLSDPGFSGASLSISNFMSGLDMLDFNINAKDGRLQQAFEQTWQVLEKIKRYGFTEGELARAKQNYLRTMQNSLDEKDKTPSTSFVKEYQNLFLHGEAAPGIAWEAQFTKNHIDAISLKDIAALLNEYLQTKDVDILVTGPEKSRSFLPNEATVKGWMNSIGTQQLEAYKDNAVVKPLLAVKPTPGKVVSRKSITELGVTELTLSNGVKVILKPTDFKNGQILYQGFSAGGTSLYDHTDFDVASNAAGLVGSFGLGDLNPVELSQTLTGKIVNSRANIGPRSQTISGGASPEDLETALQLTYLQFTQPRKDTMLFNNVMNNAKNSVANRYAEPNNVFADTVAYVMGSYSYRAAPPTVDRLDKIELQRAYDIYRERFADAGGFTFVFVGNFKDETIIPLIEQYLGSLPSTGSGAKARDLGVHIPSGRITKKVYKGTENKATVRMVYSGDYTFNPLNNLLLKAVGDVLQIKVLQTLREAEGEVYSPQVQSSYNKYPKNRYALIISFGCAPQNADKLIALAEQQARKLATDGPQADDVVKFKAAYQKNVELALKDNSFWLNYLASQYENNEDLMQVQQIQQNLDKVNAEAIKKAAAEFVSGSNLINFELLPEQSNN